MFNLKSVGSDDSYLFVNDIGALQEIIDVVQYDLRFGVILARVATCFEAFDLLDRMEDDRKAL